MKKVCYFIITQFPLLMDDSNVFTEEKVFELENCFFTTKEYKDMYEKGILDKLQLILPFRGYVDIDTLDELYSHYIYCSRCLYLYLK